MKSIVNDSTPASGLVPEPGGTEVKGEGGGAGKVVRRHPNLIGGSSFTALAVNKPRGSNEGNFVRLNINGYGKSKFKFKGRRKGYSPASGRRCFRGYKRKSTGTGGIGNKGACGEDGLVFEMSQVGKPNQIKPSCPSQLGRLNRLFFIIFLCEGLYNCLDSINSFPFVISTNHVKHLY